MFPTTSPLLDTTITRRTDKEPYHTVQQHHPKLNIAKSAAVGGPPVPVTTHWEEVERVDSYRYLGVHTNKKKLDWSHNTDAVFKKGQSTLFFLRRLGSFSVCNGLLKIFYQSVVASQRSLLWCAGLVTSRLVRPAD